MVIQERKCYTYPTIDISAHNCELNIFPLNCPICNVRIVEYVRKFSTNRSARCRGGSESYAIYGCGGKYYDSQQVHYPKEQYWGSCQERTICLYNIYQIDLDGVQTMLIDGLPDYQKAASVSQEIALNFAKQQNRVEKLIVVNMETGLPYDNICNLSVKDLKINFFTRNLMNHVGCILFGSLVTDCSMYQTTISLKIDGKTKSFPAYSQLGIKFLQQYADELKKFYQDNFNCNPPEQII